MIDAGFTIKLDGEAYAQLDRLQRDFPREFGRGMTTLGVALRARLKREYSAGVPGAAPVQSLHANTFAFRRIKGERRRNFGGRMPQLITYQWKPEESKLSVGWHDSGLRGSPRISYLAKRWQESENRKLRPVERKIRRVYKMVQEKDFDKPVRPVIEPFAKHPSTNLDVVRIVAGRIRSIIVKRGL